MEERHRRYLEILKGLGQSTGSLDINGTELITDPVVMVEVEQVLHELYVRKGVDPVHAKVGLIWENPWYLVFNEPFRFRDPRGQVQLAAYMRVLFRGEVQNVQSVFMLPFLSSGHLLLTKSYRTTVRSFTVEGVGTATLQDETHEAAIRRTAAEKLGRRLERTVRVGDIISERGIMGASVPVYIAQVEDQPFQSPTDPNVREVVSATVAEVHGWFKEGEVKLNGDRCLCQDGYTGYALLIASLKGQLPS